MSAAALVGIGWFVGFWTYHLLTRLSQRRSEELARRQGWREGYQAGWVDAVEGRDYKPTPADSPRSEGDV